MRESLVRNPQGIDAVVVSVAYTGPYSNETVFSLGITGNSTNIKAIQATMGRGSMLKFTGQVGYKSMRPADAAWLLLRENILPGMDYALFIPNPRSPDTASYLISSLFPLSKEDQLVRYLELYTVWAVRPEWKEILFEAGEKQRIVKPLRVMGVEWAYSLYSDGWDEILDRLAKSGQLTFEEASDDS